MIMTEKILEIVDMLELLAGNLQIEGHTDEVKSVRTAATILMFVYRDLTKYSEQP